MSARRCTIPAARASSPLPPYYAAGTDGAAAPFPTEEQYAICVTKGQDELLSAINEVLAELGEDGINALVMEHMGLE